VSLASPLSAYSAVRRELRAKSMKGAIMSAAEAAAIEKWECEEREKRARTPVAHLPREFREAAAKAIARAAGAVSEADELLYFVAIGPIGEHAPEGTLEHVAFRLMWASDALCRLGSELGVGVTGGAA